MSFCFFFLWMKAVPYCNVWCVWHIKAKWLNWLLHESPWYSDLGCDSTWSNHKIRNNPIYMGVELTVYYGVGEIGQLVFLYHVKKVYWSRYWMFCCCSLAFEWILIPNRVNWCHGVMLSQETPASPMWHWALNQGEDLHVGPPLLASVCICAFVQFGKFCWVALSWIGTE